MRTMLAICLFAVSIPCFAGSGPSELVCSFVTKVNDGFKIVASDIRVLDQVGHNESFVLPKGSPKNVVSVLCFRSSIVPTMGDAKVVDAGYTLILASVSSGTIELSKENNVYKTRQVDGNMSPEDSQAVEAILLEMNAHLSSSN